MRSLRTFVPPVTALRSPPLSRMTGALSPVMALSSTEAMPSMASPSPGDALMALSDAEAHELLGLVRNLNYQLITGDGTTSSSGRVLRPAGMDLRLPVQNCTTSTTG